MSEFDIEERARNRPEEIAYSIKMEWDSPAFSEKTLMLVEYDNDRRFYYKFFNHNTVEIRTTTGCNSMKRLFDCIQPYKIPNFAIQDSDFSRVCGYAPTEVNYFITDFHDHEMMCLNDAEVIKTLFENLAIEYDESLISSTFEDLEMLSYFKWYNYYYHLNVNFRGYKTRGKSKDELRSFEEIYNVVKPQSPKCKKETITMSDIITFVSTQKAVNAYEITNGHDFLDVLSQRISEKYKIHDLNQERLRPYLYACFTFDRFKITQLFFEINNWAGDNTLMILAES